MPTPKLPRVLIALLGASLLLAACGGTDELSKEDYSQQVGDALGMLADAPSIRSQIESADGAKGLASNLEQSNEQLREVSEALSAIDAPADATEINAELVKATDDLIAAVDKVIEAAKGSNPIKGLAALDAEFQAAALSFQDNLNDVADRLDEAGFPPPPSASE